jgi:lipoprotein-anchoring transpeptidase ErfK/SrfK
MNRTLGWCAGVLLFFAAAFSESGQPKSGPTLKSVAWFAGQWRSPAGEKTHAEEHWTDAAGGSMVGMFRLVKAEKPVIYEFLMLEESKEGVYMRLRHFKAEMAEVEQEAIRLKLVKSTPGEAIFENPDNDKPKRITYSRNKSGLLTVTVETMRDGKTATFALKFERVKK